MSASDVFFAKHARGAAGIALEASQPVGAERKPGRPLSADPSRSKTALRRVAFGAALAILPAAPALAVAINLTVLSGGFSNSIGIDYHEPDASLAVSVNYPTGAPYNFELIDATGAHSQFSSISGFTDEVKIASARSVAKGGFAGSFAAGTLFTGTGVAGQIAKIAPDGTSHTLINTGATGLFRGSLYVDRTGVWGGDLIGVTTTGDVYRVNTSDVATKVATVTSGTHLEGLVTVPNDVAKYGVLAGKIIAGAEVEGRLYYFDTAGNQAYITPGTVKVGDIDLITANENFYGVNFGSGNIYAATAADFAPLVGNILLTQEEGHTGNTGLFSLSWNGSAFVTEQILVSNLTPAQWEHVTFAPIGIANIPSPVPEPTTLALLAFGLVGVGLRRRRHARVHWRELQFEKPPVSGS